MNKHSRRYGLLLSLLVGAALILYAPVAHAAGSQLFTNPGFEAASLSPWVFSGATCVPTVDPSSPHSGVYDAKFGSGFCLRPTLAQAVALVQGATYTLSGWTRGLSNQCKFGVSADSHLANGIFGPLTLVGRAWKSIQWSFTWTGTSGSVYVGLWCDLQRGFQFYDDLSLVNEQATAALVPHLGGLTGKLERGQP
jgi:hypothetical protein